MSEKMTCPGCGTNTSSVRWAYIQDDPCPECGLSALASELLAVVRSRRADDALTAQLTEALKRIDKLERENESMSSKLDNIKYALEEDS